MNSKFSKRMYTATKKLPRRPKDARDIILAKRRKRKETFDAREIINRKRDLSQASHSHYAKKFTRSKQTNRAIPNENIHVVAEVRMPKYFRKPKREVSNRSQDLNGYEKSYYRDFDRPDKIVRYKCTRPASSISDDEPSYSEPFLKRKKIVYDDMYPSSFCNRSPLSSEYLNSKSSEVGSLLVSNIGETVTRDELEEIFSSVGPIISIKFLLNGIAQVTFFRKEDAISACDKFNGAILDGKELDMLVVNQKTLLTPSYIEDVFMSKRKLRSYTNVSNPPHIVQVDPSREYKMMPSHSFLRSNRITSPF